MIKREKEERQEEREREVEKGKGDGGKKGHEVKKKKYFFISTIIVSVSNRRSKVGKGREGKEGSMEWFVGVGFTFR